MVDGELDGSGGKLFFVLIGSGVSKGKALCLDKLG